jgi:acetyltransferase-like isoleucine patch superfamily enzyme
MVQDFCARGNGIYVHTGVKLGTGVEVGHGTHLGWEEGDYSEAFIGDRTKIGAFCLISLGVSVANDVVIDHYCRLSGGVSVGEFTSILYGSRLFDESQVGKSCIVGGDLIDRAVLEDNVTYMGTMAHTYRNAGTLADWDAAVQESPIVKSGSVIGERAMLIGGITVGPASYVAAGEIVRWNVPPKSVLYMGRISPIEDWRGLISVRESDEDR